LPPTVSDVASHDFPREVVPSKSLNTRPTGAEWRNDFDRICTPCDWQDLGRGWTWGKPVADCLADLVDLPTRVVLPYAVDVRRRSLLLVQHAPGFKPTGAPFLFVGQRLNVSKVVALPWLFAMGLAEQLPEAKDLGPVLFLQRVRRILSSAPTKGGAGRMRAPRLGGSVD
jgi:hypothetical protein